MDETAMTLLQSSSECSLFNSTGGLLFLALTTGDGEQMTPLPWKAFHQMQLGVERAGNRCWRRGLSAGTHLRRLETSFNKSSPRQVTEIRRVISKTSSRVDLL